MTAGLIVMAGEAVLSRFAAGYFAQALADGTPFRAESARSLLRLGILTICIPLGTQILAEIAARCWKRRRPAQWSCRSGRTALLCWA